MQLQVDVAIVYPERYFGTSLSAPELLLCRFYLVIMPWDFAIQSAGVSRLKVKADVSVHDLGYTASAANSHPPAGVKSLLYIRPGLNVEGIAPSLHSRGR